MRNEAIPEPLRSALNAASPHVGNPEPVCADCGSDLDATGRCTGQCRPHVPIDWRTVPLRHTDLRRASVIDRERREERERLQAEELR